MQDATLGQRLLYAIFNGGPPQIHMTTYNIAGVDAVPLIGAGTTIGHYEYRYNGDFMESGIVVTGDIKFGGELSIGAGTAITPSEPRDGTRISVNVSVGNFAASGGDDGPSVSGRLGFSLPAGASVGWGVIHHEPIEQSEARVQQLEARSSIASSCGGSRIGRESC